MVRTPAAHLCLWPKHRQLAAVRLRCMEYSEYHMRRPLVRGMHPFFALACVIFFAACSGNSAHEITALPLGQPTEATKIVWPEFDSVEPVRAAEGTTVTIQGRGGYLVPGVEGSTMYDESYREFKLFFDDEEIGDLGCFVNRCEGEFVIPSGVELGEHVISIEGGAAIQIEIIGD